MQEVFTTRSGSLPPPRWATTIRADNNEWPRTAATAGARHRRVQLPCGTDLTKALLAIVEDYVGEADIMRDLRHHAAQAWPDLQAWLDYLAVEGKRPKTLYSYERYAAGLLRAHPDAAFDEFTGQQINRVLGVVPPRSRYIPRSILNQWFEWGELYRDPPLETNPMRRVPKIKAGKRRPTTLFTAAEVGILENLPAPDGPLFALLFGTGMRRGDAIGLQRGHIDLEHSRVHIYDGKGGKDAIIPITPRTVAAVAELDLLERLNPAEHLWYRRHYNPDRRWPISSTEFEPLVPPLHRAGGCALYLKPHTTRHTFHRILLEEDYTLEERQLLMRHEKPETTVRQYPVVSIDDVAVKRSGQVR